MEKQLKNLINLGTKNPEILNMLTKLSGRGSEELTSDFLTNNPGIPQQIPASNVGNDNITESIESVKYLFEIKNIIIIGLIIWGLAIIVTRFFIKEESVKEDISFVNNVLLGNIGIIPLITSVWLISVLGVTMIPILVNVLPKIGGLSTSMSGFLKSLVSHLPKIFNK